MDTLDLFDKAADLSYEKQLPTKVQALQDKLQKAYEFMKQFVIVGRNMLDVFEERIDEVKEWPSAMQLLITEQFTGIL